MTLHAQMQDFFACGSSAPERFEHEGGAACGGDPGGTKCVGTGIASMAGVMALSRVFLQALVAGKGDLFG